MEKNEHALRTLQRAEGFAELLITPPEEPAEKWETQTIRMSEMAFDGRSPTKNLVVTYDGAPDDGDHSISSDTQSPRLAIIEGGETSVITGSAQVNVSGGRQKQVGTVDGVVTLKGIKCTVTGKYEGVL
jgi:hypothetical protein